MRHELEFYPQAPNNIDSSVTLPSSEFKKEVAKVLANIILFILVYVGLLVGSILLTILCGFGGFALMAAWTSGITLMLGLGMIGLGVMVFIFLIKFLFKTNRVDRSGLTEITEADQPDLFQFVRNITKETGSPFPKRIYLSPEVNASVFYDSGFWSMFLPIRKNLQIGLGLVNSVSVSEFKAVLAHEFGHFSQRSMKLGSYVYNVNHVIYNMLYDNDGYSRSVEKWGNMSGYFSLFAVLTAGVVKGIQFILRNMYSLVNKSYMRLSRQMEFHADSVAASVAGGNQLVNALRRLEVADSCYQRLFGYYNSWIEKNQKPDNAYPQHLVVMEEYGKLYGIETENGFLKVTSASFAQFNKSRVSVKDQWASHPSTDDRETHLNSLNISTPVMAAPASVLFRDMEGLQKMETEKVYAHVKFKGEVSLVGAENFRIEYQEEIRKSQNNEKYRGYFDYSNPEPFDLDLAQKEFESQSTPIEEIITPVSASLTLAINGIHSDLSVLEAIGDVKHGIKTFDFDGKKCEREEATQIVAQLKKELTDKEEMKKTTDRRIYAYYLKQAAASGLESELKEKYKHLFNLADELKKTHESYSEILQIMQPMYAQLPITQAQAIVNQIKLREPEIKKHITYLISDSTFLPFSTDKEKETLKDYTSRDLIYFVSPDFMDSNVTLLNQSLSLRYKIVDDCLTKTKKDLLDWQVQFL